MLKLLFALFMGATLWANVLKSPIPRSRPETFKPTVKEGVLVDGKMKLSISLMDALYYQKKNREQTMPLMEYLLNEFPKIDFSNLKFKKIMVVARGLSDESSLSFMSPGGFELLNYDVPRVADPNVVFGEYSQIIIEDYQIYQPLSYLSIAGAIEVNNIIIEMEEGRPNYILNALPLEGRPTGELSGVLKPEFNEERYQELYNTIMGIEDNMGTQQPLDLINSGYVYEEPVVEQPVITQFTRGISMGRIYNNQGKLNIKITRGRADVLGFEDVFSNGQRTYIDMPYQFPAGSNSVDFIFRNGYSNAYITVIFNNATADANAQLMFKR